MMNMNQFIFILLAIFCSQVGLSKDYEKIPGGGLTTAGIEVWDENADDYLGGCIGCSLQILNEDTREARVVGAYNLDGWGGGLVTEQVRRDVIVPDVLYKDGKEYTITTLGFSTISYMQGDVDLPSTIAHIESGNYVNTDFQNVELPLSLSYLENNCFCYNEILNSVKLPSRLKYIASKCFNDNPALEQIEFNSGVIRIGDNSFNNNPQLKEVLLPSSLRQLSQGCFKNCSSLERIRIPRYIHYEMREHINDVFNGCPKIRIIESEVTVPTVWVNSFDQVDKQNCLVIVPDGCSKYYLENSYWKEFKIIERSQYYNNVKNVTEFMRYEDGIYTLSGIKINDIGVLDSGDIYIEINKGRVSKKNCN